MSYKALLHNIVPGVPNDYTFYTLVILGGILLLLWNIVPKVYSIFESLRKSINSYESLYKKSDFHETDLVSLKKAADENSSRIVQLQKMSAKQQRYIEDSLEEREMILRSLLGILRGLQEVGVKGSTDSIESELNEYLVKKSHKTDRANYYED